MSYDQKSYWRFLAAGVSMTVVASTAVSAVPHVHADMKQANFFDVFANDYFYSAVINLAGRGVITGYEDGTFRPYKDVTRAQAAKMLALALGLDTNNVKDPAFKDVPKSEWYYGSIAALTEAGIIAGYEDGTFKPQNTITRAQMAKMIVLGFQLKEKTDYVSPFTDVPPDEWYTNYVGTLVENNITTGKTSTTFAPYQPVTRGQLAAFIFRSEQVRSKETTVTVKQVSDTSLITTDGKSYQLASQVKNLLNSQNASVLKEAVIKIESTNSIITKVTYLQLTKNGTAENHLVLDGQNGSLDGDLDVNADFISIKNLTVKGDVRIGNELQHQFSAKSVKVAGQTFIGNQETASLVHNTGRFYKALTYKVPLTIFAAAEQEREAAITFEDSELHVVEVNGNGASVEFKGKTTVQEVTVSANATITAEKGVTIPKLTLKKGASTVQINGAVKHLSVGSNEAVTILGTGDFENVIVSSSEKVTIKTTGKIAKLEITNAKAKITIGKDTKILDLLLPEGVNARDIIENYNDVKNNIEKIGGKKNPDIGQSSGGSSGGSSRDRTAPTFDSATAVKGASEGEITLSVDLNEAGKVYYVVVLKGANPPSVTQVKEGKDSTGANAVQSGSVTVSNPSVSNTMTVTGLTGGSQYDLYFVAEDRQSPPNVQSIVKGVNDVTAGDADQQAAGAVTVKIEALPEISSITLADESAVNEAKTSFDSLTDPQKGWVSEANKTKLAEAVTRIAALKADKQAPTSSVTTATIIIGNNVTTAKSTEDGTVYLVKSTDSVSDKASLEQLVLAQKAARAEVIANMDVTLITTGLLAGEYKVYAVDHSENVSSASTGIITLKEPDMEAPVFLQGYPKAETLTPDGFDIKIKVDEPSTIYYVVLAKDEPPPTSAQVKQGMNADGLTSGVKASGNQHVQGNEEITMAVQGLDADTDYVVYAVAEDSFQNMSPSQVLNVRTASLPAITSRDLTSFNFAPAVDSQAEATSLPIATSDFSGSNRKKFTISDGTHQINVDLWWNIPLNEYVKTPAAAVGSAIESTIQDYFYRIGGVEGLMNRTMGATVISDASGQTDRFKIFLFKPGANTITLSGPDWNYFFETNTFTGTAANPNANLQFTVSDGTNTASILLNADYGDIDGMIQTINTQLTNYSIRAKAEKVDEQHFILRATAADVQLTGGGEDWDHFFTE